MPSCQVAPRVPAVTSVAQRCRACDMPGLAVRRTGISFFGLCGVLASADDTDRFHKACCGLVDRLRVAKVETPETVFQRVVNSLSPRTLVTLRGSLIQAAVRTITPGVNVDALAHVLFSLGSGSGEQTLLSQLPQYATQALTEPLSVRLTRAGMSLHASGSVVFRHTETGERAHISCAGNNIRVHYARTPDGSRDAFRASMAFWNVCSMREMDMSRLNVEVFPPAVTLHMRSLTLLYANSCGLGEIPATIDLLACLQELSVNDNNLTRLPDQLGELKYLRVLSCARNKISSLPGVFFKLLSLETLRVSNNLLVDVPEDQLAALPLLRDVDLSGNSLRKSPVQLSGSQTLRYVNLSNNTPKLDGCDSLRTSGKMLVTV